MNRISYFLTGFFCLLLLGLNVYPENDKDFPAEEGLEYLLFERIPIVVSTGFFETSVTKAPNYSTIISDTQISYSTAQNIGDLIEQYVPGMTAINQENRGTSIAVRGLSGSGSSTTLVIFDGQTINHRMADGQSTLYDMPFLGDIKKIEVIDGPGGIVHGSGAITGFVNIIPKNGTDNAGGFVDAAYGFENKLYKLETGYGLKFSEGKDLYLYAGFAQAEGTDIDDKAWNDPDNRSFSELERQISFERASDGYRKTQGIPEPSYKFAAYTNIGDFNLNTFFQKSFTTINGIYPDANDTDNYYYNGIFSIRPKYVHHFNEDNKLDMRVDITYMDAGEKLGTNDDIFNLYYERGQQDPSQTTQGYEYYGSRENAKKIKLIYTTTSYESHSLATGLEYGLRDFENKENYFLDEDITKDLGVNMEWTEYNLFAEDVFNITDAWLASFGIRYDKVEYSSITSSRTEAWRPADTTWGVWEIVPGTPWEYDYQPDNASKTTFRVATSYEINPTNTIKLSYQQGFRYPDANEFFQLAYFSKEHDLAGYGPLPSLEPETMESYEFNYHTEIWENKLKLDCNLFYNTYSNSLVWYQREVDWSNGNQWFSGGVPADTAAVFGWPRFNWWMGSNANSTGDFSSIGLELIANAQLRDNVQLIISYGYTQPQSYSDEAYTYFQITTTDKDEWTRYPNHQIKADLLANFLENTFIVDFFMLYNSGYDVEGAPSGNSGLSPIYEDGRVLFNIAGTYHFNSNFLTKLTIKNIFENDVPRMTFYGDPYTGAAGQEKRYIYLEGKYSFQ
ncbi:MAG: TonB-dependent receptor [Candidatus Aureabacteria bacterium]|nr:TonB-dependent receptor [Candidatus Auribacterota bacterium]